MYPCDSYSVGTDRFRYVPPCSLQPDSGRFFARRIPVCSGLFRPESRRNFPGENQPESGCKEHDGTGRFQWVPVVSGRFRQGSDRFLPVPAVGMINLGTRIEIVTNFVSLEFLTIIRDW